MKQFEESNGQPAEISKKMPKSPSLDDMMRLDEQRAIEQSKRRELELQRQQEHVRLQRHQSAEETKRMLVQQIEEKRKNQRMTLDFDRKYADFMVQRVAKINEMERCEQARALETRRNYKNDLLSQMEENRKSRAAQNSLSPVEALMNLAEVEAVKQGIPQLRQRGIPGIPPEPLFYTPPRGRLPDIERVRWRDVRRSALTPTPSVLYT